MTSVYSSACRRTTGVLAAALMALTVTADVARAEAPPFADWLQAFRTEAKAKGISNDAVDRALAAVTPIERVLELDKRQPEFMLTLWRYMDIYVPDARVEKGKEMLQKHASLLAEVEKKYGVPPRFLVAFWGVETDFGRNFGAFHMLSAVATLAYDARRADFFRQQLLSAVRLVERGDVPVDVKASWAGAMGNMQFIPTTFEAYAVDWDGDGRRDLWNNLGDAFGSASNYLRRVGWEPDYTWGREVAIPADFDLSLVGLHERKKLADWQAMGVRSVGGSDLPDADIDGSLLLPTGAEGPAFIVYQNFRTIMRWNSSQLYALAVGHLADRLIGLPRLSIKKPENAQMLRYADIEIMQRLLTKIGFDTGGIDGRAGPMTKAAIRNFQKANKLAADGYPSFGLLERLRAAAGG